MRKQIHTKNQPRDWFLSKIKTLEEGEAWYTDRASQEEKTDEEHRDHATPSAAQLQLPNMRTSSAPVKKAQEHRGEIDITVLLSQEL